MTLRTSDIIPRDDHGDIIWDELTPEERDAAMERMAEVAKEMANERRKVRITLYVFLAVFLAVLILLSWMSSGRAHDWLPNECCHGTDCYPVKFGSGEVTIVEGGYYISPDHFTIPFDDARIRHGNPTQDFYVCRTGKMMSNKPHCLFPPETMF